VDCLWCASITVVGTHESLFQAIRDETGALNVGPSLVSAWETTSDLSSSDFTIQEGVEFHKGWGPLTAHDVEYTFNALNTKQTPEARHDSGGEVIQRVDSVEALDDRTARFNWASLDGTTFVRLFADAGEGIGTFSGQSFEEKGAEWMRTNIIGTGPYEMEGWVQQEGIFLRAVTDHWRKTPFAERFIYLEVPEASTRRAMLETGEVQIADIDVKDWPALLSGTEFAKAPEGSKLAYGFPFGGNYWENTDPRAGDTFGDPLERIRRIENPWIGDPYENGDVFDPNTPSMQSSLKVRTALAMAIDREAIVEVILSGLAIPGYLGAISVEDPLFKANAEAWTIPFDPDRAAELLAEAGYPDGGFTLQWWAGPVTGASGIEISEAIAADWLTRFNIKSEHDRRTYTTIRPSMVQRDYPVLRMHGTGMTPRTWPSEWIFSAVGIDSYNHGLEFPAATKAQQAKDIAESADELIKISQEFMEFMDEWQLMTHIAELPVAPLYRTTDISEWNMRPSTNNRLGGIKHPEFVRPR
jgi:ABC-type transport system substrate-binding protein